MTKITRKLVRVAKAIRDGVLIDITSGAKLLRLPLPGFAHHRLLCRLLFAML